MAVLEVVKAGHPILKEVAEPVEHVNKKMRALIEDMADTMYKTEGVGLAAPQVNVSKRIIVVDDHAGSGLIALINPEIFQHEIDHLEGHLFIEKATNLRRIADHPEEKEIV